MRYIFLRFTLLAAVAAAACNQSSGITPAPGPSHEPFGKETIVYSFAAGQSRHVFNGANPESAVLSVGGTLYGTTPVQYPSECCGLVYSFALGGAFAVVHRFKGDGATYPYGALVAVGDRLWGTTQNSARGLCCGSVFAVDPTGKNPIESYSFKGGRSDGAYPHAGLVYLNNKLYGTTINGGVGCGAIGCGTVFELNPANGAERLIYRFSGSDGAYPYGGLIAIGNTLYGMTHNGGDACPGKGCGTVFAVTPDDKLELLHRFKGGADDGAHPYDALLSYGGKLWGTTVNGGPHCSSSCGTVFSMELSGKMTSLYAFKGFSDGAYPNGALVALNGKLYGTTTHGGGSCVPGGGCGTVFSIDPANGNESVVYAFKGEPDGVRPSSTLINIAGVLYGTTVAGGGGCSHGCGTIFSVTP
jgi:uncharacterized repeat protein (TIGR03803 family)